MFLNGEPEPADDIRDVEVIIATNRRDKPWITLPTRFVAKQMRFEER
jgi:hypothetical protein